MFRIRLPQSQDLTGRDNDVTAQSAWVEFQVHFSIERTREVTFDDHAAEPFSAPDLDLRSELLLPIKLNRVVVPVTVLGPGAGYPATRHRQVLVFRGVDGKLMEGKAQILCRFGL